MQNMENAYALLAQRIQQAIDMDDLLELQECADLIDLKRVHFVEADEESGRKVIKPVTVYAAEHGNVETMRFLLSDGCDLNARDSYGNTALLSAVDANRIEMVRFLSQQPGIHLEIKNYYGETLESIAELNKDESIMDYVKTLAPQMMFNTLSLPITDNTPEKRLTRH